MIQVCSTIGCQFTTKQRWHLVCDACWEKIPEGMQKALMDARKYHVRQQENVLRFLMPLEGNRGS